jgi:hypothetical protein
MIGNTASPRNLRIRRGEEDELQQTAQADTPPDTTSTASQIMSGQTSATTGDGQQDQGANAPTNNGPRLGGGTDKYTWWTGGSNLKPRTRRASIYACRPEDFRALEKVEYYIRNGVKEEDRLGLPTEKAYKTTLTEWIATVKSHVENCGMDSVFRLFLDGVHEHYLFDEWGEVTMDDIDQHVEDLTSNGVHNSDTTRHPVCPFDVENVDRTREMIKATISREFYNALGPKLEQTMTGIHLFFLAVSHIEPATASTARGLLNKLQEKKLNKVPGMDVNTFNITIKDLVTRIQGCCKKKEHLPSDLSQVVAECYRDTQIQEFDMLVITIINRLDDVPDYYTPIQIQTMLGAKYDRLANTNRWPHKSKLQELSEEVGQLKALQRKGNNNSNSNQGQNTNQNNNSTRNRTNTTGNDKKGTTSTTTNTPEGNPALFVPPKDGAPEVKQIDGKEHKFCTKCQNRKHGGKPMWRSDKWAHTTSEHMSGKEWRAKRQESKPEKTVTFSKETEGQHPNKAPKSSMSTLVTPTGNTSPPPQGRLRLISSLSYLADDKPRRPDPPTDIKMYDDEEEEVSVSPPRHFEDDTSAENCSLESDESDDSSLNYLAGHH